MKNTHIGVMETPSRTEYILKRNGYKSVYSVLCLVGDGFKIRSLRYAGRKCMNDVSLAINRFIDEYHIDVNIIYEDIGVNLSKAEIQDDRYQRIMLTECLSCSKDDAENKYTISSDEHETMISDGNQKTVSMSSFGILKDGYIIYNMKDQSDMDIELIIYELMRVAFK